ncbi:MAG TPA: sulfotransferase, partial [Actinoplanes sp.]
RRGVPVRRIRYEQLLTDPRAALRELADYAGLPVTEADLAFLGDGYADLRVVHVVRDARGVAYSWTKTVSRPETDGTEEMTRYSPGRSAMLWNAHNAAFGLLARRGVPVRRIRYEEFLTEPRAALIHLAEFAGVTLKPADLEFLRPEHADLRVGHSAAGNPMRFTVGRLPLRRDDAWVRALPAAQRRLVGAVCAPMLRAYGYPLHANDVSQEA